jgi:hypothetical protein
MPGIRYGTDALEHPGELQVSHVLDVNSPISGFQAAPNTRGLTLVFEAPEQRIYRVIPLVD